jgi:AhpD family alkylhydroperoxidase
MAGPKVDASHWRELDAPRVPPATGSELHPLMRPVVGLAGHAFGGTPPNIFTTLARHGRLFVPWLLYSSRLMPRGVLPRRDTELAILRVAWNCRCRYEWDHHVRIGRRAGLTDTEIERVADGPEAAGWAEREGAILAAADELHGEGMVTDGTWARLSEYLDHRELIELCMLIGNYEGLAGALASLGVQPERPLPTE